MSYKEKPIQVLDKKDEIFRTKMVPLVKVLWRNSKSEEAVWELEMDMREKYPSSLRENFEDEIPIRRGEL